MVLSFCVCLCMYSPLLAGQILERIATEFNQLQFHAVQSKGMPLLDKVRPVSVNVSISEAAGKSISTKLVNQSVWQCCNSVQSL